MPYPAHIRENGTVQSVAEHCKNTARIAAKCMPSLLTHTAYLAGLLHDMGKYTDLFSDYIRKAANGEPVRRGSVNHTFAGVRFAMERWHGSGMTQQGQLTCELIACAVGSHHGLFDCIDPDGKDGYAHRRNKKEIQYDQARENFLAQCADCAELDRLFSEAESEIRTLIPICTGMKPSREELLFLFSMLERMLLSALIHADRSDTAAFMSDKPSPAPCDQTALFACALERMEARVLALPVRRPIDNARRDISNACRQAAQRGSGIFRLNVPTGGGKTLSSLRYALAAAAEQGKRRILFATPLLSILEQNAAVIRDYIGDDSLILEHHSNIVREADSDDELDPRALLAESWDAPVVITTLVQLLNTLFSSKSSCVRRMQALIDSVIVIDEVQSVPRSMLSAFNLALNFLSGVCGAAVVLCSATPPYLEGAKHPVIYQQPPDLAVLEPALRTHFRRTEIIDLRRKEGYAAQELAQMAAEQAQQRGSALVVCNKKSQAAQVFAALRPESGAQAFHLSTSMCMAHRRDTLRQIECCLQEGRPVICVSTQLIEAGVDLSFGCVFRLSAGLDNIVQAAGRCNRSGESEQLCPVYIVNYRGENLGRLQEIARAQDAAEAVLNRYAKNPEQYQNDLASDPAIEAFYRQLYCNMPQGAQDYPVPQYGTTLYALLSDNADFTGRSASRGAYLMSQAFQTAGKQFRVFEDNTQDVLVSYGAGAEVIADLAGERAYRDLFFRKQCLDAAKPYAVSLYNYEIKALQACGGLYSLCEDTVWVLQPGFYSAQTGFCREGAGQTEIENDII